MSHQNLPYLFFDYSAITSNTPSEVIVAERFSPDLHIHQLRGGEETHKISHLELGLKKGDLIFTLHCAANKLYLAVGKKMITESLHVYEVCPDVNNNLIT